LRGRRIEGAGREEEKEVKKGGEGLGRA